MRQLYPVGRRASRALDADPLGGTPSATGRLDAAFFKSIAVHQHL
jgi:hypothetical protein